MKHLAVSIKNVKGREWHFKLLADKTFDKIHNLEDEGNTGMTISSKYEVHFKKSEWDMVAIRHELGHVYFHMSGTVTADLTPLQVEETMCEIIGHNGPEIVMIADSISECFLNYHR